jgi:cysteine desulfurase
LSKQKINIFQTMSENIYLDHAATTPLAPEVFEEMKPWLSEQYWNPGGIYSGGFIAKEAIGNARESVAEILGCLPGEIIFTSGGSEANNLALRGVMNSTPKKTGHMITSAIEHHSVLHTAEDLAIDGHTISILQVENDGRVSLENLKNAIRENTKLVSVMMANNEIGTIQPIKAISTFLQNTDKNILLHTDAVQCGSTLDCSIEKLNVDLLSLSGHKFYGPRGVGALFVKSGTPLRTQMTGGAQEHGYRAGTENVAGIIGFAKALQLAKENKSNEAISLSQLREHGIQRIQKEIENVRLNGSHEHRLPNNINVSFWGVEGESILLMLDEKGISASTGSACTSADLDASHVVLAIGQGHGWAHGSIRFSLGKSTTKESLNFAIDELKKVITYLRSISSVPKRPLN